MYIPDLFGAYIKGRELAIEKNWQDLKNYEQVEAARNKNDLAALQILGERADFGGKRSIFQNNVDQSARANEVAEYLQPGMVARADMESKNLMDQRSAFVNNRPTSQQVLNDLVAANLGQQVVGAGIRQAENTYWTPERQAATGAARGQVTYNTNMANAEASTDFMEAAQRQIATNAANHAVNMGTAQYQMGQVANAIENQPAQQQLQTDQLALRQNQVAAENQMYMFQQYQTYLTQLQAARNGDPNAQRVVEQMEQQFGFVAPSQEAAAQSLVPNPQAQTAVATTAQPLVPTPQQQAAAQQQQAQEVQRIIQYRDGTQSRPTNQSSLMIGVNGTPAGYGRR